MIKQSDSIVRIGNAQGFWGDSSIAPATLIAQQPDLDYLTLDYLAEVSMSILAIQREKDPLAGFASDFIEVVRSLIPFWKKGLHFKIVTNAGGLNPLGCAMACQALLKGSGLAAMKIGVVSGDDLTTLFKDSSEASFQHLETAESHQRIKSRLVSANAYFGAEPIVRALQAGADIVITGRVADPSLTVAPCVAHFGWSWSDYDRLAGATIAGHLIECGTQVTGGISNHWLEVPDLSHIGFPVVEVDANGSCVITKPQKSGGVVSIETVKEQLLYEIGDPDRYLSPDVTVSFLSLSLKEQGPNRIFLSGAKGRHPPSTYKVSATYRDGFRAEALLTIFGPDVVKKARLCGETILKRCSDAGYALERTNIECLGHPNEGVAPGVFPQNASKHSLECVLRICVADSRKNALEFFSKEIASLVTCGPAGTTGYASGRPRIRPVFGYWPCLIQTQHVLPQVTILEELSE